MDDIVEKMKSQIGDDVQKIYSHEALFKSAVEEIESLRKQLANAADNTENILHELRQVENEINNLIMSSRVD